ncbi:MAG: hypothetical protein K2Z81_11225, partial [Cyanobacteria bacterium]|nr:hypothetical protein [Cyanobacteriota bacterium]
KGAFSEPTDEELMTISSGKFKRYPVVHGRGIHGGNFTLLNVSTTLIGTLTKLSAKCLLAEAHAESIETKQLTAVSFYCQNLDRFLNYNYYTFDNDGESESLKSLTVKYNHPEKLEWRVPEIEATFDIQTDIRQSFSSVLPTKVSLSAQPLVTLKPDQPQDVDWFTRRIWHFCNLITFLADERCLPTGVTARVPGVRQDCWLLYRTKVETEKEKPTPLFLFHMIDVLDVFPSILSRWFSATAIMRDAIRLAMDAFWNDHSRHGRFLLLAHATEVISRATTDSEYMPPDEYQKVITKMNGAIPPEVEGDHRDSLRNKIKYGNELAFHKRVTGLVDSLSPDAQKIVCVSPKKFARGVSDTRNYYTHFTDELRPKALSSAPLYWAGEKLLILFRIVLLKDLGIEEKLVVEKIRGHHRLMQHIFLGLQEPEVARP